MIAALYVRDTAAPAILVFVVVGIVACAVRLWWCWWTLGTCPRCGKAPRECSCPPVATRLF